MIRLITDKKPFVFDNDTEHLLEFQMTFTSMENKHATSVKVEFTEKDVVMVLIDELPIHVGTAIYFTQPYGVLSPKEGMIVSVNNKNSSPIGVWFEVWEKR